VLDGDELAVCALPCVRPPGGLLFVLCIYVFDDSFEGDFGERDARLSCCGVPLGFV
jgi:hypothetical protein